ncbi:alpha-L-fucosidase [Lutibacter aestuarii]|uniref:alpha-L-fucosidase n=1 Tax=Lutibacter aestuarii TaxID=861111 RepID=A0ABW2Z5K1_9FLAO
MRLHIKMIFKIAICFFTFFKSTAQQKIKIEPTNTIEITQNDTKESIILKAAHVIPTKQQFNALKDEFIAFIHFGPNTFTGKEWGSGMEDPQLFELKKIDTDQWCEAMKSAGMTKVIFTAKHHDGFCLWQTRYTKHGIMSTNFKKGEGDVLKNLAASCQKYGLKLGVYLSPADLFQIENPKGLYGNGSKITQRIIPKTVSNRPFKNTTTFTFEVDDYNEYFLNQLFELLTEYGPIHEVWFDGAHPKRKGNQQYNYQAWKELIKTLAPEAVIFGKEDVRWCGNEAGKTRKTEWNIIPYKDNPNKLTRFDDITSDEIGERPQLYNANFLHYQFAEVNTSIRSGWFYRDDEHQQVRNADDVFDMYERAVGGNTVFLLNIPPNKEGKFSSKDVAVLQEVGKRIKETYAVNLFQYATGPKEVLDLNDTTYKLFDENNKSMVISTPTPVTINRLVLQEAIATHSERIEKYAVDAWLNNKWTLIAEGTNVGYKKILRFKEVTSTKFRLRILKNRFTPAISLISAHYYKATPPQLTIHRTLNGMVKIEPKTTNFSWKPHGENSRKNLQSNLEIRYTIDGSTPTKKSKLYTVPFKYQSGIIKAVAYVNSDQGSISAKTLGILKNTWKVLEVSSEQQKHQAYFAFDENPTTYWQSTSGTNHSISIDLGKLIALKGFEYLPPKNNILGMIEKGTIYTSTDGSSWEYLDTFEFGNLINDPSPRTHYFNTKSSFRFVKIVTNTIAGNKSTATISELNFFK